MLPKTVSYIYWLSQIQHSEQSLVGDKLYILSQLLRHEYPILPGFVLGSDLWHQCCRNLENTRDKNRDYGADEGSLSNYSPDFAPNLENNPNDYQSLQSIAQRNRQIINQISFSAPLSAKIFQAAQQLNSPSLVLQTFVTVPYQPLAGSHGLWRSHTCKANSQAIDIAIKKVWSELFSAHGLLYWHKLGLKVENINLAVLVRPLQNAYASGTIELNPDTIKIKAAWGLEDSLIQGDVEPDEYDVDRLTGCILAKHLGQKNYGYRPRKIPDEINFSVSAVATQDDCLEAYIPQADHTQIHVLDPQAIAQLMELVKGILGEQPQIRYLVWTLLEPNSKSASQPQFPLFYFTQLSNYLSAASPDLTSNLANKEAIQDLAKSAILPLLIGIGASPGKVTAKIVIIEDLDAHEGLITADCILVTKNISPHLIHLVKQAAGIITETGGRTSHGAIIARELNIPAVVNAAGATKILQNEAEVLLNGDEGKVYSSGDSHLSLPFVSANHVSNNHVLAPNYPIATKLMINLSQPERIGKTLNLPIDGVGLLRSELMLAGILTALTAQSLDQEQQELLRAKFLEELVDSLRQFVRVFAPRPIFYRSLDWYPQGTLNPMVGNRGTYSYICDPALFYLELEAIATITAEGYTNLKLILPYVRSVAEFKFCYRHLENMGLASINSFQVWIMAEVPSVLFLLPEYVRAGVQGIAIGTNDLTQLLLGADREQTQFSDRGLNANHPAMHQAISQLIASAKAHNIECCICGQAPVEYPELIDKLVTWGIDAISVEPEAVSRTYKAIARAERRILLKQLTDNNF